jgi:hypothetical protein
MSFSPLELTFGVELEHKFVLHESLLQRHVTALHNDSYIMKDHDSSRGSQTSRDRIPAQLSTSSWVIAKDWKADGHQSYEWWQPGGTWIWAYEQEALRMENDILRGVVPQIEIYLDPKVPLSDFSHWHITTDASLQGSKHLDKFKRVPWLKDERNRDECEYF